MANGKDSDKAVRFMKIYAQLRDRVPEPGQAFETARTDPEIAYLCSDIANAAVSLEVDERRHRRLFAAPVDPDFQRAWRDYEDRYSEVCSGVWAWTLFGLEPSPERQNRRALLWKQADEDACEQASQLEEAIKFAEDQAAQDWRFEEDVTMPLEEGIAAWERLKSQVGLDLRGVFRRRQLIPFILVPRHVAAGHGETQTLSLYKNLQQAHESFIFGAPFAALILMRSVMESVLRKNYEAQGADLSERIDSVRAQLPPGAHHAALHRLRMLANAVVHLDEANGSNLSQVDTARNEETIVSLLFVLRSLIEGAPNRSG